MPFVLVVPIAGIIAIIFALYMAWDVLRRDPGTPQMQEIGGTILEGAKAFLKRQYRTIGLLAVLTAVGIGFLIGFFEKDVELGVHTGVAFIVGALTSGVSGFIGMYIAVRSNLRCASAAQRGLREAADVALRGGAVSGFLIVALSLLGVAGIFYAYGGSAAPDKAPFLIVGFGFGASFVALFAQLGGGFLPRPLTWGPTWWARWRPVSPRMTHATPP